MAAPVDRNTAETDIAAAHLARSVPIAMADTSVDAILARLPGHRFDVADAVYVTDGAGRLVGSVRIEDLFDAASDQPVATIMTAKPPAVTPETDQEAVAVHAIRHSQSSVPVVDAAGRFLGVVPPRALMDILRREHVEDIHRIAGVWQHSTQALAALEAPLGYRVRRRLPWLLVGLLGSIVATAVMAHFERALEEQIAIAFFVPALVYLADAIGTQSEAIAVRGLSLSRTALRTLLAGEVATGMTIGAILGAATFALALASFGDTRLAAAVAVSLFAAATVAAALGLVLPWLFGRLGADPAFGSGPVGTIIQDVLTLLIYFGVVTLLLA
jgi:magnesium transporter